MIPSQVIGRCRDSVDDELDMLNRYMPSKPAKQDRCSYMDFAHGPVPTMSKHAVVRKHERQCKTGCLKGLFVAGTNKSYVATVVPCRARNATNMRVPVQKKLVRKQIRVMYHAARPKGAKATDAQRRLQANIDAVKPCASPQPVPSNPFLPMSQDKAPRQAQSALNQSTHKKLDVKHYKRLDQQVKRQWHKAQEQAKRMLRHCEHDKAKLLLVPKQLFKKLYEARYTLSQCKSNKAKKKWTSEVKRFEQIVQQILECLHKELHQKKTTETVQQWQAKRRYIVPQLKTAVQCIVKASSAPHAVHFF